jgi:hypothetical protein
MYSKGRFTCNIFRAMVQYKNKPIIQNQLIINTYRITKAILAYKEQINTAF